MVTGEVPCVANTRGQPCTARQRCTAVWTRRTIGHLPSSGRGRVGSHGAQHTGSRLDLVGGIRPRRAVRALRRSLVALVPARRAPDAVSVAVVDADSAVCLRWLKAWNALTRGAHRRRDGAVRALCAIGVRGRTDSSGVSALPACDAGRRSRCRLECSRRAGHAGNPCCPPQASRGSEIVKASRTRALGRSGRHSRSPAGAVVLGGQGAQYRPPPSGPTPTSSDGDAAEYSDTLQARHGSKPEADL